MRQIYFLLWILPFVVHGTTYNVVPRRVEGTSRPPSASPQLISFDGDLDYIIEQALKRAGETGNGLVFSDAPSSSPVDGASPSLPVKPSDSSVLNAYKCDNASIGHLEILTFQYSIETALGANVTVVIGEVEEILLESIAPHLLACRNGTINSAGIVALDSLVPADTPSKTEKCSPVLDPLHTCTVVDGSLSLFLSSQDTANKAIEISLKSIESALKDKGFVRRVETGLVKITFISSNDDYPASVTTNGPNLSQETGLSATSSASLVVASALIAALVGAVYYFRQGRNRDGEASAIQEAGSSFAQPSPRDPNRPTSPFSEMLPGAYKMGDLDKLSILSNSNMSPVYEDDDGSQSVVVSESGYTTEAAGTDIGDDSSLTYAKQDLYTPGEDSNYMAGTSLEYLGARPRDGVRHTSDLEMSDSELDSNSDVSSQASPRKLYSTSLLLPSGYQDESIQAEDILLFENERTEPGISTENSMVDISLSGP